MTQRGNTLPPTEYFPISWVNATGTRTQLNYSAGTPDANQSDGYVVQFTLVSSGEAEAPSHGPIASWTEVLRVGSSSVGGTKPMALQPGGYTLLAIRSGAPDSPVARPFHVR